MQTSSISGRVYIELPARYEKFYGTSLELFVSALLDLNCSDYSFAIRDPVKSSVFVASLNAA
jgi:hypothetical protein